MNGSYITLTNFHTIRKRSIPNKSPEIIKIEKIQQTPKIIQKCEKEIQTICPPKILIVPKKKYNDSFSNQKLLTNISPIRKYATVDFNLSNFIQNNKEIVQKARKIMNESPRAKFQSKPHLNHENNDKKCYSIILPSIFSKSNENSKIYEKFLYTNDENPCIFIIL